MKTQTQEIIENLNKNHKLTQAKLAECVGVTPWTVNQWISGKHSPRPKEFARLRRFSDSISSGVAWVDGKTYHDSVREMPAPYNSGESSQQRGETKKVELLQAQITALTMEFGKLQARLETLEQWRESVIRNSHHQKMRETARDRRKDPNRTE